MRSGQSEHPNVISGTVYFKQGCAHYENKAFEASINAFALGLNDFQREKNRLERVLGGNLGPIDYTKGKLQRFDSVDILIQIGNIKQSISDCNYYIGVNHFHLKNYEAAEVRFYNNYLEAKTEKKPAASALSSYYLGLTKISLNKYLEALDALNIATKLFKELAKLLTNQKRKYEDFLADSFYYIGFSHRHLGNYAEAEKYYKLALNYYQSMPQDEIYTFRRLQTSVELNIILAKQGDGYYQAIYKFLTDRAIAYQNKSNVLYLTKLAEIDQWVGICYLKMKQPSIAITYFEYSLNYYQPQDEYENYLCSQTALGICYALKENVDIDKVISYLKPVMEFMRQNETKYLNSIVLFLLNQLLLEEHILHLQNSSILECKQLAQKILNFKATIQLQQPLKTEVKQPVSIKIETVSAVPKLQMKIEKDDSESQQQSLEVKEHLKVSAPSPSANSVNKMKRSYDCPSSESKDFFDNRQNTLQQLHSSNLHSNSFHSDNSDDQKDNSKQSTYRKRVKVTDLKLSSDLENENSAHIAYIMDNRKGL